MLASRESMGGSRTVNVPLLLGYRLRGRQGQLGGFPQHVSLLVREHALESLRIQHPVALIGGHCAQVADGCFHHLLALRCEAFPLPRQLPCLLFLLWCQVLPGFNPVQPALLLIGGQTVEVLQAVFEALLLGRRQLAELRIVQQGLLLVGRR
jgi:hypothetical protein